MQAKTLFITPDNPCRNCNGTGTTHDRTERGTWIAENCWQCVGTGSRFYLTHRGEVAA